MHGFNSWSKFLDNLYNTLISVYEAVLWREYPVALAISSTCLSSSSSLHVCVCAQQKTRDMYDIVELFEQCQLINQETNRLELTSTDRPMPTL